VADFRLIRATALRPVEGLFLGQDGADEPIHRRQLLGAHRSLARLGAKITRIYSNGRSVARLGALGASAEEELGIRRLALPQAIALCSGRFPRGLAIEHSGKALRHPGLDEHAHELTKADFPDLCLKGQLSDILA
jgi:hypothetical protein